MKQILALLTIVAATQVAPALAQSGPSETQQRFACMGDAVRLCPQHIPNRDRIIECMAAQRASLSAGCRPVFDASLRALKLR